MKQVLKTWFFLLLLLPASFSFAEDQPDEVILNGVNVLLAEFNANRDELKEDREAFFEMVDQLASPYFDFFYISKLLMGQYWKQATDEQQQAFSNAFKELMILTYAAALFQYDGKGKIEFTSKDIKQRKNVRFSEVNGKVTLSGGNTIVVTYYVLDAGSGWKVYNLHVGGLDMILHYRETLSPLFREYGIAGAIEYLQDNNAKS